MDLSLESLSGVLEQADYRAKASANTAPRIWPTGFDMLDVNLTGGFRSAELVLLAGPQGLGKTTWALQVARNVARSGRVVLMFSYEHDLQTLLTRLVALEAAQIGGVDAPDLNRVRKAFEGTDGLTGSLRERLGATDGGAKAIGVVEEYADRLILHRSSGGATGVEAVRDAVDQVHRVTGQIPLVIIDYLQKMHVPNGSPTEAERVTLVVEGLKDLALDRDLPVLAVVAADKEGLQSGKRMRVSNLRGSSALAYEADTVLILNNKYDVVARHHLVYNTTNADRFKQWVVLSIEKNRNGQAGIDLEFPKRFEQARFETEGRIVSEQLVDERMFVE